jgi:DNA helicase-2/ATP-dependent DNA helicase PcrA
MHNRFCDLIIAVKHRLAVLVKSKADTLSISSYLSSNKIFHEVLIDPSGPSLAATCIAKILEPQIDSESSLMDVIRVICNHLRGRKGEKATKKDLVTVSVLDNYIQNRTTKGPAQKRLIEEISALFNKRIKLVMTGSPEEDWHAIRKLFQDSQSEILKNIYEDARYIRLLNRGALLSDSLAQMWRTFGCYTNASKAIETALAQEHFSMSNRSWRGIFVMNIHKSKGKEFDEVIIWEELHRPIIYKDSLQQGRLLLRVAITRARSHATFLTPASDCCVLI